MSNPEKRDRTFDFLFEHVFNMEQLTPDEKEEFFDIMDELYDLDFIDSLFNTIGSHPRLNELLTKMDP